MAVASSQLDLDTIAPAFYLHRRVSSVMRDITEQERQAFHRQGVVHLSNFLDDQWLGRMRAACAQEMAEDRSRLEFVDLTTFTPMIEATGAEFVTPGVKSATGRFCISSFNWQIFPALAELCCGPPLPERIAALMQSHRLNFYGEQLFIKEAGSLHRTAFHQDTPYFHVTGDKCCTVWIPLEAVDSDNGMMGYVLGSHLWQTHAANGFITQMPIPGSQLPKLPDIEGNAGKYDIVYYPAEPGDVIVHHANMVHGSTGNRSSRDRFAYSLHYLGDDVRYCEREGATALDSGRSPALKDGDLMDCREFPLVWSSEEGYLPLSIP